MNKPYRCPNCKTNKSRFNIIEQVATPVKLHPQTGEIEIEYHNEQINEQIEVFHQTYQGPDKRVQCAMCGLIEDESRFMQFAMYEGS